MTRPPPLDGPGVDIADPHALLLGYLDWYRDAVARKLDGLTDARLRAPIPPLGWSPLGLVQHLGWVERRWMRWGFAAEDLVAYPAVDEWHVPAQTPTADVLGAYADEVREARRLASAYRLDEPSRVGGRFATPAEAPTLGRILFHLLQEYARHVGHLDIARELLDGRTGE
ncbi:MAG: hypothetical protein JWN54_1825 [Mycobacterium sp.]|nr:hypothetical protein [Mycobacterium sp.]